MEDFFFIPITKIETNWITRGFGYSFYDLEYCEEVLDIPIEYISEVAFLEDGLEIGLIDTKEIQDEDWYIQLKHLSKYEYAS